MPVAADTSKRVNVYRPKPGAEARQNLRWWTEEDADRLYASAQNVADRIESNLSSRHHAAYLYNAMYNGMDVSLPYASATRSSGEPLSYSRIDLNVVQSAIDTLAAMIAKNRPEPTFLADTRDYKIKTKARLLTKFVDGLFDDAKVHNIAEQVFIDACIQGTGFIHIFARGDEIQAERVNPIEILVDDLEGLAEQPSQMHRRRPIDRDKLIEDFPDKEEEILKAESGLNPVLGQQAVADLIMVTESWHLKSGPNAEDGRYVVSIKSALLADEPYTKDRFPILPFRWYHATAGYWGRGVCQEVGRIQREINKILRTISKSQDLVAVPVVFVPRGSCVSKDALLSNLIGRVIEYTASPEGGPPQYATPPGAPPELYSHLAFLTTQLYQLCGVNAQLSAGQKPNLGPDASGAAIRESTDLAALRFMVIGQRYEDWYSEIAGVVVDLARDLYKSKDLTITVADKDGLMPISWKDVHDLHTDLYKIKTFETSALPLTPAGRIQMVSEWAKNGWIGKEQAMRLMDIPDIAQEQSLETATPEIVDMIVQRIKDEGRYDPDWAPIPQMDLNMAFARSTKHTANAYKEGLPHSTLDAINSYTMAIDDLRKAQAAANAPPPGPSGPPPGGPDQGPPPGPPGPPGAPPGPPPGPPMQQAA